MKKNHIGALVVVSALAFTGCATEQAPTECMVASDGWGGRTFAARLIVDPSDANKSCGNLKGDFVGLRKFYPKNEDGSLAKESLLTIQGGGTMLQPYSFPKATAGLETTSQDQRDYIWNNMERSLTGVVGQAVLADTLPNAEGICSPR